LSGKASQPTRCVGGVLAACRATSQRFAATFAALAASMSDSSPARRIPVSAGRFRPLRFLISGPCPLNALCRQLAGAASMCLPSWCLRVAAVRWLAARAPISPVISASSEHAFREIAAAAEYAQDMRRSSYTRFPWRGSDVCRKPAQFRRRRECITSPGVIAEPRVSCSRPKNP